MLSINTAFDTEWSDGQNACPGHTRPLYSVGRKPPWWWFSSALILVKSRTLGKKVADQGPHLIVKCTGVLLMFPSFDLLSIIFSGRRNWILSEQNIISRAKKPTTVSSENSCTCKTCHERICTWSPCTLLSLLLSLFLHKKVIWAVKQTALTRLIESVWTSERASRCRTQLLWKLLIRRTLGT